MAGFGADFAYTLDGGDITDYEYETFNAAKSVVTINGFSIHPGTSKDKMKNAILIAQEFNGLLPPLETPAHTEGYQGFFHLQEMHGVAEKAVMEYIIRDHSMERFLQRKAALDQAAEQIDRRYGPGTAVVDTQDQYYNMYEVLKDHMEIVALAEAAKEAAGIPNPPHTPNRGGTAGCMLTNKALLCPQPAQRRTQCPRPVRVRAGGVPQDRRADCEALVSPALGGNCDLEEGGELNHV